MSVQHEEESIPGDRLLQRSHEIFNEVLKPVDGIRGTWSWMLEKGNHGYGIVPFIVDVEYWDQIYHTIDVTKGSPEVLPAFVEWVAPVEDTYAHLEGAIPVVEIVGGWWLDNDSDLHQNMAFNNWWLDDHCYYESGGSLAAMAPVWSVTPISEDICAEWMNAFAGQAVGRFDPYISSTFLSDSDDCHGEYYDEYGRTLLCQGNLGEADRKCPCGLEQAQIDVHNAIYDKSLWVDPGSEFRDVWKWTVTRWLDGWQAMNTFAHTVNKEDPLCPSSLVSLRSPYFRTLAFDALAREKERLSSIPSMSSPLWQESLTEPSPQLTLFAM